MEYNLVVFGAGGVGKSALTMQLVHAGHFVEDYDPTVEDAYRKQVDIDVETCVLQIMDTAGQDEYARVRSHYIDHGEGFLLVYSVTGRMTFESVTSFRDQILRAKERPAVPMVICGNKCDLEDEREVSEAQGRKLATGFGVPFFEASAKLRLNVDESFFELVREIRKVRSAKAATVVFKRRRCLLL
eukprot:c29165_g1_i1.p1 GENE.c29165_g1_i1~~c29165_g1_i1.p1  ORF type:complete len:186 (+),score=44.14 c29165_g1_i1:184-741(+)